VNISITYVVNTYINFVPMSELDIEHSVATTSVVSTVQIKTDGDLQSITQ